MMEEQAMLGHIVVLKRNGMDGPRFPLEEKICLVGRDDSCDIRVQKEEISRHHMKFSANLDGLLYVESLSKTNETLLNGEPIVEPIALADKDVVTIADRSFRWEYGTKDQKEHFLACMEDKDVEMLSPERSPLQDMSNRMCEQNTAPLKKNSGTPKDRRRSITIGPVHTQEFDKTKSVNHLKRNKTPVPTTPRRDSILKKREPLESPTQMPEDSPAQATPKIKANSTPNHIRFSYSEDESTGEVEQQQEKSASPQGFLPRLATPLRKAIHMFRGTSPAVPAPSPSTPPAKEDEAMEEEVDEARRPRQRDTAPIRRALPSPLRRDIKNRKASDWSESEGEKTPTKSFAEKMNDEKSPLKSPNLSLPSPVRKDIEKRRRSNVTDEPKQSLPTPLKKDIAKRRRSNVTEEAKQSLPTPLKKDIAKRRRSNVTDEPKQSLPTPLKKDIAKRRRSNVTEEAKQSLPTPLKKDIAKRRRSNVTEEAKPYKLPTPIRQQIQEFKSFCPQTMVEIHDANEFENRTHLRFLFSDDEDDDIEVNYAVDMSSEDVMNFVNDISGCEEDEELCFDKTEDVLRFAVENTEDLLKYVSDEDLHYEEEEQYYDDEDEEMEENEDWSEQEVDDAEDNVPQNTHIRFNYSDDEGTGEIKQPKQSLPTPLKKDIAKRRRSNVTDEPKQSLPTPLKKDIAKRRRSNVTDEPKQSLPTPLKKDIAKRRRSNVTDEPKQSLPTPLKKDIASRRRSTFPKEEPKQSLPTPIRKAIKKGTELKPHAQKRKRLAEAEEMELQPESPVVRNSKKRRTAPTTPVQQPEAEMEMEMEVEDVKFVEGSNKSKKTDIFANIESVQTLDRSALEKKKVAELKDLCKERDVDVPPRARKADLIDLLCPEMEAEEVEESVDEKDEEMEEEEEEKFDEASLSKMKVAELKALCTENNIEVPTRSKKADLVALLMSSQNDDEEEEEGEQAPCEKCGSDDDEDNMLLCDTCDKPYHTKCVGLKRVPKGDWFCEECKPAPKPKRSTRSRT